MQKFCQQKFEFWDLGKEAALMILVAHFFSQSFQSARMDFLNKAVEVALSSPLVDRLPILEKKKEKVLAFLARFDEGF